MASPAIPANARTLPISSRSYSRSSNNAPCRSMSLMTMRSDFLGECDSFYSLPSDSHSQYLVPRLTHQQRQQAIEGPIRLFGQEITTQR